MNQCRAAVWRSGNSWEDGAGNEGHSLLLLTWIREPPRHPPHLRRPDHGQ